MVKKLLILVVFIGMLMISRYIYAVYSADIAYKKSQDLLTDGQFQLALINANKALELNPLEPNYYKGRAKVYLSLMVNVEPDLIPSLKEYALNDLEAAYKINPNNLVTVRNIIPLYYFLAAGDISKVGGSENIDPQYVNTTREFYSKVKNLSPNDVGVYALLAKYEKRLGFETEYSQSVEKVRKLRPDLLEWYLTE